MPPTLLGCSYLPSCYCAPSSEFCKRALQIYNFLIMGIVGGKMRIIRCVSFACVLSCSAVAMYSCFALFSACCVAVSICPAACFVDGVHILVSLCFLLVVLLFRFAPLLALLMVCMHCPATCAGPPPPQGGGAGCLLLFHLQNAN